jgi:ribosomal protein S8
MNSLGFLLSSLQISINLKLRSAKILNTKFNCSVLILLLKEKFILGFSFINDYEEKAILNDNAKYIIVFLKYINNKSYIKKFRR